MFVVIRAYNFEKEVYHAITMQMTHSVDEDKAFEKVVDTVYL